MISALVSAFSPPAMSSEPTFGSYFICIIDPRIMTGINKKVKRTSYQLKKNPMVSDMSMAHIV